MNNLPENLSPATLAYLGDAVFELMARERAVKDDLKIADLHQKVSALVCAKAQSRMYNKLSEIITPEEHAILKRGRNTHTRPGKSSTQREYQRATGVEALFGYLFLKKDSQRLKHIFAICTGEIYEQTNNINRT